MCSTQNDVQKVIYEVIGKANTGRAEVQLGGAQGLGATCDDSMIGKC